MRLLVLIAALALSTAFPIGEHDPSDLRERLAAPSGLASQAEQDTKSEEKATKAQVEEALDANKNQITDLATACKQDELNAEEAASNKKALDFRQTTTTEAESAFHKTLADAKNKQVQERGMIISDHGTETVKIGKEYLQTKVETARAKNERTNECIRVWQEKRQTSRNTELAAYKKSESDRNRASRTAERTQKAALESAKNDNVSSLQKAREANQNRIAKIKEEAAAKKGTAASEKAQCLKDCASKSGRRLLALLRGAPAPAKSDGVVEAAKNSDGGVNAAQAAKNSDAETAFKSCESACRIAETSATSNAQNWGKSQEASASGELKKKEQEVEGKPGGNQSC